jgi:hypothetical protein
VADHADIDHTGLTGVGAADHGALTGLTDDDHTQYTKKATLTTKGDIYAASAASTPARVGVGSDGQVLTADSAQSSGVKWAAVPAGTFVGCKVGHTSTQSINNNSSTLATFGVGTEQWDTDAFHDTGSNTSRLTIPSGKDGKYVIVATTDWASNSTGVRRALILKNGSSVSPQIASTIIGVGNSVNSLQTVTGLLDLVATDYIELQVLQVSGGSLNVTASLSVHKVG